MELIMETLIPIVAVAVTAVSLVVLLAMRIGDQLEECRRGR
jgi:hypothetical protein